MAEMAGVHMRMTEAQLNYIKARAVKKGINQSEVVRNLIDKAIIKDARK
jgi:predicted DNA binding CopG/RHH family protein